ncbi:carbonic anhydrase [Gordonia sp. (in: high G+C Gram-positive bacteria)]|jgi:carbonic anhydrase|uniref:carbonic anhydrase n=1 Tax=Gordonia sp. (in: high G+C Gram-positive bacteria) TaxID=84139 RepID=UPI001D5C6C71|nr:carbonic anhydrase [Gordonia sp. (in: high G+C Gram-positive bacteria)]MCB1294149.1 carbonic anhydrase [Gordonia sp. (in: high G+C Gram-positive bacteria)]HMS76664.1 carbonic anhydrase [Gordonia sp. (in: high G+C Gram-positive bacteria)]HQV20155.1 carbonic anhydrase [Gordonia sp. (in: high G+C Gram-positive bacteria)]
MTQGLSPRAAWRVLREGNERFVSGESIHPSQGIEDRERLVGGQHPHVVLFGCGDSRLAAEIIFDQGLGDMFVVRTAGHVIDSAVLGSLEYGPVELDVPLIVILGHDNCGAISATLSALDDLQLPTGYIRDVVEKVAPSILAGRGEGLTRVDEFEARHVVETGRILMQRSRIISDRVNSGKLAIVGLTYNLDQGKIHVRGVFGDIGEVTIEPM